jgi:hypothetical protein
MLVNVYSRHIYTVGHAPAVVPIMTSSEDSTLNVVFQKDMVQRVMIEETVQSQEQDVLLNSDQ